MQLDISYFAIKKLDGSAFNIITFITNILNINITSIYCLISYTSIFNKTFLSTNLLTISNLST